MQSQNYTHRLFWFGLLAASLVGLPTPVTAQVIPDATLGTGNNSLTNTIGDRTDITGGLRLNSALFHSFQQFNINTGSQVYFANPAEVRNIFSRVTGSDISRIDGLLGVTGPANLFFMNPNGIIFGANARLDISGSFFATTANVLEFPDGQKFAATGDRAVPLVEVNIPMGLQMGVNPPAMLTSRGTLTTGQNLTLAAGNLDLQGQLQAGGNLTLNATDTVKIRDTVAEPFVARSGGNMTIQGNQAIDILTLNYITTPFQSARDLTLVSSGLISTDAHFYSGRNFSIHTLSGEPGNFISLFDPIISANGNVTFAAYTGPALKVEATGSITITGDITITSPDTTLAQSTSFGNFVAGTGTIFGTLNNGPGSVSSASLENSLSLTSGALSGAPFSNGTAREGSAVTARFNVAAAGDLTFDWNFSTSEGVNSTYNDFSFYTLAVVGNPPAPVGELADTTAPLADPPLVGYPRARTGIQTIPIAAPGTYVLGLGVVDVRDASVNSALQISNLQFGGVNIDAPSADPDIQALTSSPALILRAGVPSLVNTPTTFPAIEGTLPTTFNSTAPATTPAIINVTGGINTSATASDGGLVLLNAPGNITVTRGINSSSQQGNGGNVDIESTGGSVILGTGRSVSNKIPDPINTSSRDGSGGNIRIQAASDITLNNLDLLTDTNGAGRAGDISISSNSTSANAISLIDTTLSAGIGNSSSNLDTQIFLFDATTRALLPGVSSNDDSSIVQGAGGSLALFTGSTLTRDSYLRYSFDTPGDYVIGVGGFFSSVTSPGADEPLSGNRLSSGTYALQLSIPGVTVPAGRQPEILPKVEPNNAISTAQDINDSFAIGVNPNVENSDTIPYVSISGSGNNTYDYYRFTIPGSASAATPIEAIFDIDTGAGGIAGAINLTSLGGISLSNSQVDASTFGRGNSGNITVQTTDQLLLTNSSIRTTVGSTGIGNGGNIQVNTQTLSATGGSRLEAQTLGTQTAGVGAQAGNIAVVATGDVTFSGINDLGAPSGIFTSTEAANSGLGGTISIQSNNLTLSNRAVLSARTNSAANGGNIDVNVNSLDVLGGGQLITTATTNSTANAGSITVAADRVRISGSATPFVTPVSPFTGVTNIQDLTGFTLCTTIPCSTDVESPDRIPYLTTNANGNDEFAYYAFSVATAGTRGIFDIDNTVGTEDTQIFLFNRATGELIARNDDSPTTAGAGGSTIGATPFRNSYLRVIFPTSGEYLLGVARFYTYPADYDPLLPSLRGPLPIAGNPGTPIPSGSSYTLQVSLQSQGVPAGLIPNQGLTSGLYAQAEGTSNAGNVVINTPQLTVEDGGRVIASTTSGASGDIQIQGGGTGQVVLTGGAQVAASNVSGTGGSIQLAGLSTLQVTDSLVSASTTGNGGSAGSVTVEATNSVALSGTGGLSTQATAGDGSSGQVSVTTSQLTVQDGANITAATDLGIGNNITLSGVNSLQVSNGSGISASTQSGAAGNIILNSTANPATTVVLDNGSIAVRANATGGTAGSVTLNARSLDLQNNSSIQASNISTVPTNPDDGNITLAGLTTLNVSDSQISASTQSGAAGSILLNDAANPATAVTLDNGILAVRADAAGGTAGSVTLNARSLTLQDNSEISAANIDAPSNPNDGNITLAGLNRLSADNSQISASTSLGVAGNVQIDAAQGDNPAIILTNNSVVAAAADNGGSAGGVTITTPTLNIRDGASVEVSSSNGAGTGGDVTIAATTVTLSNGTIEARTDAGGTPTTAANVNLTGLNTLIANNSSISASTNSGVAGNVAIVANQGTNPAINLTNNSVIAAAADDGGSAGGVNITTPTLTVSDRSAVAASSLNGTGTAGNVVVVANTISLSRNSQISVETDAGGASNPANITLQDLQTLSVTNSLISSSTSSGVAGNVDISATQSVQLQGTPTNGLPGGGVLAAATNGGDAGSVRITTPQLTVTDGAEATVSSTGNGTAGNLEITAPTVLLSDNARLAAENQNQQGTGGNVQLQNLTTLQVLNNSQISASTETGRAGNVTVNQGSPAASSIALNNGSTLFVAATENGGGTAGNVLLNTQQLSLDNASSIAASTAGSGTAGNLTVNANGGVSDRVSLNNNSFLAVESTGSGNAGTVSLQTRQLSLQSSSIEASTVSGSGGDIRLPSLETLQATDSQIQALTQTGQAGNVSITAANSTILTNSTVSVAAEQGGTAGNFQLATGIFRAFDNSLITVSSPTGLAGNLNLTANDFRIDSSTLSAQTGGGNGNGANITLQVFQTPLLMRNGSLISANATGTATGGNITITSPFLIALPFENSDIQANALQGQGGQINITTQAIIGLKFRPRLTPLSDITASSESGNSGTVSLTLLSATDPTKASGNLPTNLVNVSNQITQSCASGGRSAGEGGRFTIAGRGGVPASPTAFLPAVEALSDWVSLSVDPQASVGIVPADRLASVLQGEQAQASTCAHTWRVQQLLLP